MTTLNNRIDARSYSLEFSRMMKAVFEKRSYFSDLFDGGLQITDGIRENETVFYVKTNNTPVVLRDEYDIDPNTGFGTGTGSSSRFGERQEIIYTNTPVNYKWQWAYHEGIDRFTVNAGLDDAVADRLELQAIARMQRFNTQHGKFIAESCSRTLDLAATWNTTDTDTILKDLFTTAASHFVNEEIVGFKIAYVTPDVYNALVDNQLITVMKNSDVDIDMNSLEYFKDFFIKQVPEKYFADESQIYFAVTNLAVSFMGINTARAIESEDFDGVALQGAGKAGEFILDDNKIALIKADVTTGTRAAKATTK